MGFRNLGKGFKQALPVIMTVMSCVGIGVTAGLSVKAGMKIEHDLAEKPDLNTKETAKVYAKHCTVPVIFAAVTIAALITGKCIDKSNFKRQKAELAALYAGLNKAYKMYQDEAKQELGEEKHQKIMQKIGQEAHQVDICDESFGEPCNTPFDLDAEEPRTFYDEWSGEYFQVSPEQVYRAMFGLNRIFSERGYVPLRKWYELLGVKPKKDPGNYVWTAEDDLLWLDFINSCTKTDDGFECWTVGFVVDPYEDPGYTYTNF